MQRALVAEERAIDGGQLDGRDSRRPRSAHLHPTNRRWGTALGDPWQCSADCFSSLVASVATTVANVAPRPANGAKGERGEGGPTFLCKRVPGDGASEWSSRQLISRAATIGGVRAPVCNDCAGRRRAPTAGLKHAPSRVVDAVERVTRGLRIEGGCSLCLLKTKQSGSG